MNIVTPFTVVVSCSHNPCPPFILCLHANHSGQKESLSSSSAVSSKPLYYVGFGLGYSWHIMETAHERIALLLCLPKNPCTSHVYCRYATRRLLLQNRTQIPTISIFSVMENRLSFAEKSTSMSAMNYRYCRKIVLKRNSPILSSVMASHLSFAEKKLEKGVSTSTRNYLY